jgi:pyruvate-formate lyase-activating enzyme
MSVSIAWCQPDGAYRQNPGIAQSHLKSILISPAHYQAALTKRWQTTPNMLLGSALHCAVLEGTAAFESSYIERPDDIKLNTKDGKEWAAEQKKQRKTVLTGEQTQQLKGMVKALQTLEWFEVAEQERLRKYSELSIYWEWCGMDCKARLDRVIELEDKVLVLDLKTTDSVQPKKFIDKVIGLNYMFQAAYYTEAAARAFKKPAEFIFIGVERDAPHSIDYFCPGEDMVAEGHKQCEHALSLLKQCILTDEWPNQPPTLKTMSLPDWYKSPVSATVNQEAPLF